MKKNEKGLHTGLHTGDYGMVSLKRVNGRYTVKGWILHPISSRQVRIDRAFYDRNDANIYAVYVKEGERAFNQRLLNTARTFSKVNDLVSQFRVEKKVLDGTKVQHLVEFNGEYVGSVMLIISGKYGVWSIFDAIGTEIGHGLSKQHALGRLALHLIGF